MSEGPEPPVAAIGHRAPGEDPGDPYAEIDLETLPAWWRNAVAEFEAYGLRPYRPPQFADGRPKHEVVAMVEANHDVDIAIRGVDVTAGDDWTIHVDGEAIGPIGRRRSPAGYTVFECTAERFAARIRAAVATADE